MKTIRIFFAIFTLLSIMTACEKDGDKIYLSGLEGNELVATKDEVVLLQETSAQLALSLAWSSNTLSVSNPNMTAPNILSTYIQASTESDFSSNVVESLEASYSKAYTGAELNAVAKNLGAEPDVATTFYFRLKGSVGSNTAPVYSNILSIDVTPYTIDMSVGYILDSKMEDTGRTLYSPESNGIYKGFMGATGWYNFYMKEGDGAIWGNDGVEGTAFLMSSEDDSNKRWNFWFPSIGGCYFTEVNTTNKLWSALLIPTLKMSGDVQADMEFDRPNVRWTTTYTATAATTLNIKLSSTGKQYDYSTGTDDDNAAVDTNIAFAQNGTNIILSNQAGDISVSIPAAGEYTIVVDLSNPREWKCEAVSGSLQPDEIPQYIYLPGIDDGVSGSWTFDKYLSLYNEEEKTYAGVIDINSLWGYGIYTEKDSWDNPYKLGTGDAYSGTLELNGTNNIPAPAAGLYLMDVSTKTLKYELTGVGNTIYVVGLDDKWTFDVPLTATGTTGVYTGAITFAGASPWGFQIHTDISWNHYFGGTSGSLYYKGDNIKDDASLTPGTYQMTVDLVNGTYTINP